jgi:hypothetical protein
MAGKVYGCYASRSMKLSKASRVPVAGLGVKALDALSRIPRA